MCTGINKQVPTILFNRYFVHRKSKWGDLINTGCFRQINHVLYLSYQQVDSRQVRRKVYLTSHKYTPEHIRRFMYTNKYIDLYILLPLGKAVMQYEQRVFELMVLLMICNVGIELQSMLISNQYCRVSISRVLLLYMQRMDSGFCAEFRFRQKIQ